MVLFWVVINCGGVTFQHPNWGKFKCFVASRNELEAAVQARHWSQQLASFPDSTGQGVLVMGPAAGADPVSSSGWWWGIHSTKIVPYPGHWATQCLFTVMRVGPSSTGGFGLEPGHRDKHPAT